MIKAEDLLALFEELGLGPYVGVPCSILNPLISTLDNDPARLYVKAASEGEAMGVAAGWNLSGSLPVILMQNSGLGNAINPLTSLQLIYRFPCLLMISWRGEPGRTDAPQHRIMGQLTPDLLRLLQVPAAFLQGRWPEDQATIRDLRQQMVAAATPVALIVPKGTLAPAAPSTRASAYPLSRLQAIQIIAQSLSGREAVISTTGKISRELYNTLDRDGNFYMVGSMGCASAIGLGLALSQPHRPVVVLDGDGACLMKMGNLATIGHYRPRNLIHVVLDNEVYDSTGGQGTTSATLALAEVAQAASYRSARQVAEAEALRCHLAEALAHPGPHFLQVKVAPGARDDLARPQLPPPALKERFTSFLQTERP